MVVAESRGKAEAAVALIEVTYDRHTPLLSFEVPRASTVRIHGRLTTTVET